MTIFGKFSVLQNGFLLITYFFKLNQTSSPVATPTKSGMARRSKRSKLDLKILIFPGPIFFRSGLFVVSVFLSGTFFSPVLKVLSFKTLTDRRGLKNPIQRTTFYLQRSSGARVMVGFMFFFSGLIFVRSRLFVVFDFFLASFLSLVLKASSLETMTDRRGVKNPIQRTTFHVQRSSRARVMVGFAFAKFLFFTPYFRKVQRACRPISSNE